MRTRARKILDAYFRLVYLVSAIVVVAFVADFADFGSSTEGSSTPHMDALGRLASPAIDIAIIIFALVFWLLFAALLVEFLSHNLFNRRTRAIQGAVLMEVFPSTLLTRFIAPTVTFAAVILLNLIVFGRELLPFRWANPSIGEYIIFWFFYSLAHLLLVVSTIGAFRKRPFFVISDQGFLYELGGVSLGFVRWTDVENIEESEVIRGGRSITAPYLMRVMLVKLRNPEEYFRRYTLLARLLIRLLMRGVALETGRQADLAFGSEDFRERYEDVKRLMFELCQRP